MSTAIQLLSKVRNGVIPLPRGLRLAEGSEVALVPLVPLPGDPPFLKAALNLARPRGWPRDFALNHGHYTKGTHKIMRTLFADTFYFIALLNSSDPAHARAVAWSRQRGISFLTTEYVLIELGDAFHAPGQREEFALFQDALRADPAFRVLPSDRQLYDAGLKLFRRRRDKHWQLTDCISFAIMHRLRVREALTGDQHFIQAGFNAVLAEEGT